MLNIRPIFPQSRQQLRRFNFRLVARLLGVLLLIQAATMVVAIAVSVYFGDGSQYGLILSGLVIFMLGVFLRNFVGANCSNELHEKESLKSFGLIDWQSIKRTKDSWLSLLLTFLWALTKVVLFLRSERSFS